MLQWMDNFSVYGPDGDHANLLNGAYADNSGTGLTEDPDTSVTGMATVQLTTTSGVSNLRRVLSGPQTTVGVAVRQWATELPEVLGRGFRISFSDINAVEHCYVTMNPSGYLLAYRRETANTQTLIGQSTGPVIVANAWQHLEVKVLFHDSAGSIQVRVEGTTMLNITGVKTTANTVGAINTCHNVSLRHANGSGGNVTMWKDFVIWDDTGSVNNNFLGLVQVYKIVPDSDVTLNWTPNSGSTGYTQIDEADPDEDTTYISASSALPDYSQFTMTNLPDDVTAVKGVMTILRSKKTDGGDGNMQASLVSDGVVGTGAERSITTAYTYWTDIYDEDPAGGNWSKEAVDAVELRVDRTS